MSDPRIHKLAKLLIHYSVELQPGQQLYLRTDPLAEELALAVYAEAIQAGGHVFVQNSLPGAQEIFYKLAADDQLDFVSPIRKLIVETIDANLVIGAEYNTRQLSGVDPERIARDSKAAAPLDKLFMERAAREELRWCYTEYPTHASAQEADMSLPEYQDFVFGAGMLDEADPVEDSANGWVRFRYPAIFSGREVSEIELWFEDGKIVRERAIKGQELLTSLLDSDSGARYLGEWGIGTNYYIRRFTKNMLFDEKIGGTIHLAVGASYPETGGKNDSGLHWDMLCDMTAGEILVDGELFYKNGKPAVGKD